jgi:hypothetical protein
VRLADKARFQLPVGATTVRQGLPPTLATPP